MAAAHAAHAGAHAHLADLALSHVVRVDLRDDQRHALCHAERAAVVYDLRQAHRVHHTEQCYARGIKAHMGPSWIAGPPSGHIRARPCQQSHARVNLPAVMCAYGPPSSHVHVWPC